MTGFFQRTKHWLARCRRAITPPTETPDAYWLRPAIQTAFVLFSILLGLEFRTFLLALEQPQPAFNAVRPPAVDGYLPISSLMSLVYFVKTGIANTVRPAGLVIFSLILLMTCLLRRGFCSWVCPFGTASEWLHRTGKLLFGRNVNPPWILDVLLRSLKYLLFGFFFYYIVKMPTLALHHWIHGSYNRISDAKMFLFFFNLSATSLVVFGILGVLSMLIKNAWCRYLCPYGALLAIVSVASPTSVKRRPSACNGCGRCSDACPNRIAVHRLRRVSSPECTACYRCVQSCSHRRALRLSLFGSRTALPAVLYGVITVAAFIFAAQTARSLGYWHPDTPLPMYKALYTHIHHIEHPRVSPHSPGQTMENPNDTVSVD